MSLRPTCTEYIRRIPQGISEGTFLESAADSLSGENQLVVAPLLRGLQAWRRDRGLPKALFELERRSMSSSTSGAERRPIIRDFNALVIRPGRPESPATSSRKSSLEIADDRPRDSKCASHAGSRHSHVLRRSSSRMTKSVCKRSPHCACFAGK